MLVFYSHFLAHKGYIVIEDDESAKIYDCVGLYIYAVIPIRHTNTYIYHTFLSHYIMLLFKHHKQWFISMADVVFFLALRLSCKWVRTWESEWLVVHSTVRQKQKNSKENDFYNFIHFCVCVCVDSIKRRFLYKSVVFSRRDLTVDVNFIILAIHKKRKTDSK